MIKFPVQEDPLPQEEGGLIRTRLEAGRLENVQGHRQTTDKGLSSGQSRGVGGRWISGDVLRTWDSGWRMGWVWRLRKDLGKVPVPCLGTWLGVGAFTELGTWEKRLGFLEGDTELRLSSKVSPNI